MMVTVGSIMLAAVGVGILIAVAHILLGERQL